MFYLVHSTNTSNESLCVTNSTLWSLVIIVYFRRTNFIVHHLAYFLMQQEVHQAHHIHNLLVLLHHKHQFIQQISLYCRNKFAQEWTDHAPSISVITVIIVFSNLWTSITSSSLAWVRNYLFLYMHDGYELN